MIISSTSKANTQAFNKQDTANATKMWMNKWDDYVFQNLRLFTGKVWLHVIFPEIVYGL